MLEKPYVWYRAANSFHQLLFGKVPTNQWCTCQLCTYDLQDITLYLSLFHSYIYIYIFLFIHFYSPYFWLRQPKGALRAWWNSRTTWRERAWRAKIFVNSILTLTSKWRWCPKGSLFSRLRNQHSWIFIRYIRSARIHAEKLHEIFNENKTATPVDSDLNTYRPLKQPRWRRPNITNRGTPRPYEGPRN